MKEYTQIENYSVEIWRRPYQRSMHLTVRPEGHLRVTCGRRVPKGEISRFVSESREFILKRLLELESMRKKFPPKQILSGETFLFFGKVTPLEVIWTWDERIRVQPVEGALEISAPLASLPEERRAAMVRFFRKQAHLHLRERVEVFAERMGVRPSALAIRGQSTRWGSCSSAAKINLNWKLLACPEPVIDYVVVHELAHIRHLDHSKLFWSVVAHFHPEWREAKQWLRAREYEIGAQFR